MYYYMSASNWIYEIVALQNIVGEPRRKIEEFDKFSLCKLHLILCSAHPFLMAKNAFFFSIQHKYL